MTYFTTFIKNPRNVALSLGLIAVVVLGVLFLERSFSPVFDLSPIALAEGGDGGGDGGGGSDGGGCCGGGGDGGGGGDPGPGPGDFTPAPAPPPPPPPTDICINIAGVQTTVPAGMVVDSFGNCTTTVTPSIVCTLTSSSASVVAGGTATLTWTSSGATSATLSPGGAIAVNGSQTVTVNSNTTYTATFTGSAGVISCSAGITVTSTPTTPSCTTNCGGGGGINQPNITLFSTPGEQPLAFVSLSQIPYTGFDAGPFGIALFWMVLVMWSAFVAWLIVIKRVPQNLIEKYSGGVSYQAPRIAHEREAAPMSHVSSIMPSALAMPMPLSYIKKDERPVPVSRFSSQKIATRAADAPVRVTAPVAVAHTEEPVYVKTPVVLSETSDYVSAVPLFIGWIAEGHSEKAFNFLRNLKLSQKSAQDFMEKVVCELDDAYRCRIGATAKADDHTHAALSKLSNAQVEMLIEALATAVDHSYGSDYTSAKIALVRALGVHSNKQETVQATATLASGSSHVEIAKAPVQALAHDGVDEFIMAQIQRLRS